MVIRNLLSHLGGPTSSNNNKNNTSCFLTSGVTPISPMNPKLRFQTSLHLLQSISSSTTHQHQNNNSTNNNTLFGILLVGNRLISLVQSSYIPHQIQASDLLLLLNFCDSQQSGLLAQDEAWLPLCLPKFEPSGFLYAYVTCLDKSTKLTLVLVSTQNTTEQFQLFRGMSANLKLTLGIVATAEEDGSKNGSGNDEIQDRSDQNDGDIETPVVINAQSEKAPSSPPNEQQTTSKTNHKKEQPCAPLIEAIHNAIVNNQSLMNEYCEIASAMHFCFRCDVLTITHKHKKSKPNKKKSSSSSSESHVSYGGGKLAQSITPPFQFPFSVDTKTQQTVWNVYQRLVLRLRNGSASTEATMAAFHQISIQDNEEDQSTNHPHEEQHPPSPPPSSNPIHKCHNQAQSMLDQLPSIYGVTYIRHDNCLYVGLNGRNFEFYAVLPGIISGTKGTALCARLVRRLMNDRTALFVEPLTWT